MDPVIISLQGEYDVARQSELRGELAPYYHHPYLVIDMTQIAYVDSVCLSEFMRLRKERTSAGLRPATFVVNNDRFGRLFRFLGLDDVFTVVESIDEALTTPQLASA
jgi:anti-anti-sigma factor